MPVLLITFLVFVFPDSPAPDIFQNLLLRMKEAVKAGIPYQIAAAEATAAGAAFCNGNP